MENIGCVTFNESMIFRSKVTEAVREDRANAILHEMAHMWFGDLVTMRWWDDLWLNESFDIFMSARAGGGDAFQERMGDVCQPVQGRCPASGPAAHDSPD